MIFALVAMAVASTVLTALLAPRPPKPRPSALGDFQFPTAEEGRVIPVGFGTFKVSGPNVTWYGDLRTVPVTARSGLFSRQTVGYEYWIGMQMALCHGPVKGFAALSAGQAPDDIGVVHGIIDQTIDRIRLLIDAPEQFGGERREGGLRGEMRVYFGTEAQTSDDYLSAQLGLTAPEYHGLCYVVLKNFYIGTSNYPKPLSFTLRRNPNGLGSAPSGNHANPAEIIYEAMTNTQWGLGIPTARFNLSAWQAAAATLLSEGMLMSLLWDSEDEAQELIGDVLRHIDGVLYTDPATGLWNLKLARADYDVGTLLELTEADLLEPPEFSRGSWEETWNEVKVTYIEGATFKPAVVEAHDSANQQTRGAVYGESMDFLGFTNATIANKVAMRELKTHSYPFAKVTLKANRKAWPLRVGGVFKLAWAPTGITTLVFRVLGINWGELEHGVIEITAIEDAFAVGYAAFDAPVGSGWVDPLDPPEPPDAQILVEAPFEWLAAPVAQERILVGCVRGDWSSRGYEIWGDEGAGFYKSNSADRFCPSGFLTAAYLRTTSALDATGFTLDGARDLANLVGTDAAGRARGDCLLLFEDTQEICAFQGVVDNGDGTFDFTNIVRGVYDTLPADHADNARVFVIRDAGTWFLFPWKGDEAESIESGGDEIIVVED